MKWLLLYPWTTVVLANLLGFIFMEGATRTLAYNGAIPFKHYPTSRERTLLDDINPHFGVWRYPNRNVRHTSACFDVEYRTNSHGMRDEEVNYKNEGGKRIVVLGDSFVEGFGVEEKDRFTELAETASGIEMLNFGTSGDFGSTQEYLVYKHLAKKFEHDSVALYFLPSNDFRDNDPAYSSPKRYRPYLKEAASGDYEIYYPVEFSEREQGKPMSPYRSFRRALYNNIYIFNAVRQLGDMFERSELKDSITDPFLSTTKGSYDDYSEEDLKKLVWGYRKIAEEAQEKPFHIFIIPREVDFIEAENGVHHRELADKLKSMLVDYKNVSIHDLLPLFQERMRKEAIEHDNLFLPCDGHWSKRGHELAADILQSSILLPQEAVSVR